MWRSARCAGSSPTRATGTARSWSRWIAGIPRARPARSAGTCSMSCGWMSGSGSARNAGPCMTAMSMPHGICWRRVFASWPVVTTGTCAWMREMHARKRFWSRCSQRKREAGNGTEPVWNSWHSVSSAVKKVKPATQRIRSLLVANRGEIAIRVMRAASELGLRTVAIYSQEDRFSLHRTKADEAYLVGPDRGPVEAYLDIADVLAVAREARVDAIHPGYGFLSENPEFARATCAAGIVFIGPQAETLRLLGNKVTARELAMSAGVPVMPATAALPASLEESAHLARSIGYPVMLKASWGGGGRGVRVVTGEAQLKELLPLARREAQAAFGNDEVYLEKLVARARHVEVQLLGDHHGTLVHLFERDCTVQRRKQKVVERAPAVFLTASQREELCAAALAIGRAAHYHNAGTVEFLQDADSGHFYFIEVNPRIQVEHTVTECATGIDLVKAQIRIADGARIGSPESGVPGQADIRISAHALQCRITSEDPENNFIPDYGKIAAYRSPAGFGIRLDAGTAYTGAIITRSYDSLLVKVTAWSPTPEETIARM